jgi:pimeloyl-ACP methyl ester carboxylesterase
VVAVADTAEHGRADGRRDAGGHPLVRRPASGDRPPDLKGFGGSDAPEDPTAYSVESYTDDAADLPSLLDLPRAVVAGAGVLGRQVALALFERHREQVAALALAGATPTRPPRCRRGSGRPAPDGPG